MKRTINILLAMAFILAGSKGPSSLEPDVLQSEDYPIEFAVSCNLSVESKAVINDPTGFVALGGLTTADEWMTNQIFGDNGTEVTPTSNNTWTYSPVRYWQPGSYVFAGVMPSALSCTPSLSANNHKQLTLDFGTDGFDLSATQTDLLVAFDEVFVESTATAGPVDFDFAHQFALVVIQGASVDPNTKGIEIQNVKVYGNTKSTTGNMVFTYAPATGNIPSVITSSYTLSSTKTTLNAPYKSLDGEWALVKPGADGLVYNAIVSDLLVFPEQCTFNIAITYKEDNITKTRIGSLSANWAAGKKYTYSFNLAADISFSVSVSDWTTAHVNKDTPIEII